MTPNLRTLTTNPDALAWGAGLVTSNATGSMYLLDGPPIYARNNGGRWEFWR